MKKIPEVGMGVTYGYGSDRYPATIIEISKNGKQITIQDDTAVPGENFDYYGNQNYSITQNPNGSTRTYTFRKRGIWVQKGSARAIGFLTIGSRDKYSDPSF